MRDSPDRGADPTGGGDDRVASLYQGLFELSRDAIYLFRPDGVIEAVNRRAVEQTGRSESELVGSSVLELHPEESAGDAREQLEALRETGYARFEIPFRRADGRRWVGDVSASRVEVDGEPLLQAVVRDVTGRIRRREALRRAKQRLEAVFDIVPVALTIQDPDTHEFLRVNRAFEELFGYDRDEVLARPELITTSWEDPEQREQINRRVERGATVRNEEVAFRDRDGNLFHTLFSMTEVTVAGQRRRLGAAQDITPRVRAQRELRHRALHDPLTELPNRALFWDRLEHALARARRTGEVVAVLFLDLDGFKEINDLHGHAVGDEVLRRVASHLAGAVRDQDTLARLGGDEFGVLLEGLEAHEDAHVAGRRVMDSVPATLDVEGTEAPLSLSGGIAFATDDLAEDLSAAADELVRRADRAMYGAKKEPGSALQSWEGEAGG